MGRIFTKGLGFPEGPVRLPGGDFLFVEMTPETGCVTRVSADGHTHTRVATTGRPNGLAQDRDGVIWVAETAQCALLKLTIDGAYEKAAMSCDGETFLFLNDVAIAPNGDVYFTDSGIAGEEFAPGGQLNPKWASLNYDGRVYRYARQTGDVTRIDNGIQFTNGLAFGPDGNFYVNETLTGNIYRYVCSDGVVTGPRTLFGNVIEHPDPAVVKGPDGMKFAANGDLYVCVFGQGDVTVLAPDGQVKARHKVEGVFPTNLVFGADGEQVIYVTEAETGTVQILDVGADGFPLWA